MYIYVYKYLALALKPDNQIAISARSYYFLPRDCERLPAQTKKAFANVADLYARTPLCRLALPRRCADGEVTCRD